jgi:selenocysteine-specific elongation factor
VVDRLVTSRRLVELALPASRTLLLHADRLAELESKLLAVLAALHERLPLLTTHDRLKVFALLDYVGDPDLLRVVTDRLLKTRKLVGDEKRIARADFKPRLSANQRKLKDKIVDTHAAAGFQPPEPKDFANQAGGNAAALKNIFEVAVAEGFLVPVSTDVYLHADVDADMRRRVTERLSSGTGATVAEIRDLLGTTRKFAVPICEYLDRVGLTRRDGDLRFLAVPVTSIRD